MKTGGLLDFTLLTGLYTSHIHYKEKVNNCRYIWLGTDLHDNCYENRKTEKTINVNSPIYGIVHKDGKLFSNGGSRGLCVVS